VTFRTRLLFVIVGSVALVAAACSATSGDDDVEFPRVLTLGEGEAFPNIVNHTLAIGPNRVLLTFTDRDDEPIAGADVKLRFYDLNSAKPAFESEASARYITSDLAYVDETSGGERVLTGETGVYLAIVVFDGAGDWGAQIFLTVDGRSLDPFTFRFNVLDRSPEPAIGDSAPASRQLTLSDVAAVEEIDSSSPPRPQMHDLTIADALARRRPFVVGFATPAFCTSRTCGPVMESVMDPLSARYGDRADFIHVEPYDLAALREGDGYVPAAAAREWRLDTEPWIFVVGSDGRIVSKFEGIVALDEVEAALLAALEP